MVPYQQRFLMIISLNNYKSRGYCLTFSLLKHLLHVGCFPLKCLHMFPLLVLELAQLRGEGGGLVWGHKISCQKTFGEEWFGTNLGLKFSAESFLVKLEAKCFSGRLNCTWPSLPRLPGLTFWGEPPAFLIKLNGDGRSLLRGPGSDWRIHF